MREDGYDYAPTPPPIGRRGAPDAFGSAPVPLSICEGYAAPPKTNKEKKEYRDVKTMDGISLMLIPACWVPELDHA